MNANDLITVGYTAYVDIRGTDTAFTAAPGLTDAGLLTIGARGVVTAGVSASAAPTDEIASMR